MIYYIVAIEEHGREWVVSTHDTADRAAHYLENYRATVENAGTTYRIDTVESEPWKADGTIRPLTAMSVKNMETLRQGLQWKVGDIEPFKVGELFPPKNKLPTSNCVECGAYVTIPWQTTHTTWHNKVADL